MLARLVLPLILVCSTALAQIPPGQNAAAPEIQATAPNADIVFSRTWITNLGLGTVTETVSVRADIRWYDPVGVIWELAVADSPAIGQPFYWTPIDCGSISEFPQGWYSIARTATNTQRKTVPIWVRLKVANRSNTQWVSSFRRIDPPQAGIPANKLLTYEDF